MVYLLDDDSGIRNSLRWVFQTTELSFRAFATAEEFFEEYVPCIANVLILDLQLGSANGLALLQQLRENNHRSPVIIVTGTGDVPSAVQSMKLGVIDFLQKPVDPQELVAIARAALHEDARRIERETRQIEIRRRFDELTNRERELIPLICSGMSNKQIANKLALSIKTVINHRAHLLEKVNATNTADLVRLATTTQS